MLINPFMSCSARLPVYVLIIGAFFPKYPAIVLFGLYGFGIVMAVLVALIFRRLIFRSNDVPFVMELPPYRIPTLKTTLRHMWHKGSLYLKKMGGIILVASIIIWALGYFPGGSRTAAVNDQDTALAHYDTDKAAGMPAHTETDASTGFRTEQSSYIERIGRFIEPVLSPLGFDWKMGVALVSGLAAKEIVVSTMGVLYHAESEGGLPSESLGDKLKQQRYPDGTRVFTTASALSFLVFILLYFPCVAVIAAIKNESGHWKWAVFMVLYTTGLAWIMSFLVYNTVNLII